MPFLLRDLLFTPSCLGCAQLGQWTCQKCLTDLKIQTNRIIPNVDQVITAHNYEGWLRERVIAYKSGNAHLARAFAEVLLTKCLPKTNSCILIPIPSSHAKIQLRQLDTILQITKQIHLLDRNYQVIPSLKLIREVSDQVGLSVKLRTENMKNAFGVSRKISGEVILVDDVITTGSTVASAAKTLKLAGAKTVSAIALCSAGNVH